MSSMESNSGHFKERFFQMDVGGGTSVHLQTFHFHSCSGSFRQRFPVDHQLFIIKSPLADRPPDSSDVPERGAVAPGPSPLSRPRSALRVAVEEALFFIPNSGMAEWNHPFTP